MTQRARTFVVVFVLLLAMQLSVEPTGRAQGAPPSADRGEDIIPFLNQTLVWHRQLATQQQSASEPSDLIFLNDGRRIADQVVRLSFDFARARAQSLAALPSSAPATNQTLSSSSSQYQRFAELAAKADLQVKQSKTELDGLRSQMENAPPAKRAALKARMEETQSELDLYLARRDVMRSMLQVSGNNVQTSGNLLGQIEELARAVPAASTSINMEAPSPEGGSNVPSSQSLTALGRGTPTGILALASDLFSARGKIRAINNNLALTADLVKSARAMRAPLVARIRELTQKGDQLSAENSEQTTAALAQQKKDLEALTTQYRQIAASVVPLGRQAILLDVYQHEGVNWRTALEARYKSELVSLAFRLLGLAIILGFVFGLSEIWRRATFRYITDTRRRYQFLLIRRIVLWVVVAVIVAMALASELGSITTFAGLLTAGIAVALQNVILSIAGYFFLVGKYGVRVGDRVQIGDVTGDVVDIGLVRLHLMEISHDISPRPTGRVVVFSNAVVFQAGVGMFKQIPGTSFLWHEVTLTLSPETDYHHVEERMMTAVNRVYGQYKDKMEAQRRNVERSLNSVSMSSLAPEGRLRLTSSGLEMLIRYPVETISAAEIDDRMTRELLDAIEQERKVGGTAAAAPTIKLEEKPA
jgi:small-conductance mechanosensitive channel